MSTKKSSLVYKWINYAQFLLLPSACIVCKQSAMKQEDLCENCEAKLFAVQNPCLRCALPLPSGGIHTDICGSCIIQNPPFHFTLSAYEYSYPLSKLISDFKYHGKLCNGKVLANQLAHKLQHCYYDRILPELIIPVPLHKHRLRQRGFNQAEELSQYISKYLNIPINNSLCLRVEDNQAQQGLTAKKRLNNLRQAFAISPSKHKPPYSVAIIDDVITTMATITHLSKLLLEYGVQEIHIWSIARACK